MNLKSRAECFWKVSKHFTILKRFPLVKKAFISQIIDKQWLIVYSFFHVVLLFSIPPSFCVILTYTPAFSDTSQFLRPCNRFFSSVSTCIRTHILSPLAGSLATPCGLLLSLSPLPLLCLSLGRPLCPLGSDWEPASGFSYHMVKAGNRLDKHSPFLLTHPSPKHTHAHCAHTHCPLTKQPCVK